ncbi:protein NETWORKED 4A-like [Bidens hawaiensis]|uniref:protein NETWORKED 4A-like n=1 Tax=Bidens hawaiensis TaxID=980011 RepID=UPI00404A7731
MEGVESKALVTGDGSQINPAISVCLEENVQGFEKCAKEILKLIEQDGNFSEMTAEVYDDKKSKLSTHVTELLRMHGVLVNQHVQLIKKQHLDVSDSSSPQVTQMFTPDQMSNTQKFRTPIGFDVSSSCGGGSYASRSEGSESSFSLSSDSDSESFISTNKLLISPVNGGEDSLKVKDSKQTTVLLQKISALEDELVTLNKKFQTLSQENTNLKQKIQENESDIKTQNSHFETEKTKAIELEKQVSDLKLVISDSNLQIKTMGDELDASRKKLLAAEDEISKLMHELDSARKTNLELQEEVSVYVADISVRDDQITELNTKIDQSMYEISLLKSTHKADIERLQMEIMQKCQSVDDLNKNLDGLKLKKDGLTAQLDTLRDEKSCQDDLVRELETRLSSLQPEHERVLSSFDNAQKVINELKLKVTELESEVEMQREVISVRAEEKREAIRQLSFSLEHYMSGYKQLRQAFVVGNRRRPIFTF